MFKFMLLTTLFSCATTVHDHKEREEIKESAVCKNTLQRDIHRNECMR